MNIEFDEYDVENIYDMIASGYCTREDVVRYYNNEWWDATN